MSHFTTAPKDRVPIIQKAAYGAGSLINNLLPGALGVFSFFLLTAFGMDPFLAGLLGGLPRIYDAITDPIMGYISDNTKSKWGRRKPYIFCGCYYEWTVFYGIVATTSRKFTDIQLLVLPYFLLNILNRQYYIFYSAYRIRLRNDL
jgi:Na+/melibiose symporter-like transporter